MRCLLVAAAAGSFLCGCTGQQRSPSLLLVSLDTVRADRLGIYGSSLGLTPHLDELARESVRFEDVTCQVPLTTPSHASILTGLLPQHHGIRNNESFHLNADVPTLAEILRKAGYRTGAFIGAYPLHSRFGLSRGFEVYDEAFLGRSGVVERRAEEVLDAALRFVRKNAQSGEPFFAFVHLFDAHSPYEPPPPFDQRFAPDRYGGEIAYVDASLGKFFSELRRQSWLDQILVSVVSDHGEALGEHGENTHGALIYQSTVRVAWVLRLPGARWGGRTVSRPVRTIDVAPTLLGALGLPPVEGTDGVNLTPFLGKGESFPELPVYAESLHLRLLLGWAEVRSLRRGSLSLIDAPVAELYDLATDPAETNNLIETRGSEAARLEQELQTLRDNVSTGSGIISPDVFERLAILGYAGGTTRAVGARPRDPKEGMAIWREIEAGTSLLSRDPERARSHIRRALELDPGNGLALKLLGDIELRAGNVEESLERYRESKESGFDHVDLDLATARAKAHSGRTEEALTLLSSLPEIDEVLMEEAQLEMAIGRPEKAREHAEKLLRSHPESIEALLIVGQSLRVLSRLPEAENVLKRGLDSDPSDARLQNELGSVLATEGRTEEAEVAFRRAIELDPDAAEPRFNLARIVGEEEGSRLLKEAIRLRPDYVSARVELAKRLAEAGRIQEAAEQVRRALRERPDDPEAVFVAARLAELLGRREEAVAHYRRFLRLAPAELREAKEMAERRLEALAQR